MRIPLQYNQTVLVLLVRVQMSLSALWSLVFKLWHIFSKHISLGTSSVIIWIALLLSHSDACNPPAESHLPCVQKYPESFSRLMSCPQNYAVKLSPRFDTICTRPIWSPCPTVVGEDPNSKGFKVPNRIRETANILQQR